MADAAHAMEIADGQNYGGKVFADLKCDSQRLTEAEFERCTFDGCNFREAAFYRCRFTDCTFVDCDLSLTRLPNARFTGVAFKNTKAIGIDWTQIGLSTTDRAMLSIGFEGCSLDFSTFYGLTLSGSKFLRCSAKEVEFSEADLSGSDFRETDLELAKFFRTNLQNANFVGALNYDIDPRENRVKNARFSIPEAVALLRRFEVNVDWPDVRRDA
jgi:fluoroquinolone resistance protein